MRDPDAKLLRPSYDFRLALTRISQDTSGLEHDKQETKRQLEPPCAELFKGLALMPPLNKPGPHPRSAELCGRLLRAIVSTSFSCPPHRPPQNGVNTVRGRYTDGDIALHIYLYVLQKRRRGKKEWITRDSITRDAECYSMDGYRGTSASMAQGETT
jgi:hypothetical protein